jgi:hypothetical protein
MNHTRRIKERDRKDKAQLKRHIKEQRREQKRANTDPYCKMSSKAEMDNFINPPEQIDLKCIAR